MSTLFSTSLRRVLYASMVIFIVIALLSMANAPAANAQNAWTPTPTGDVSGQIIGGAPANPGEWPWQVALEIPGAPNFFDGQYCGGSLIAADWVLTAAHCATQPDTTIPLLPTDIDVVAGIYDLATPTAGYQRRDVAQVIVHPNYDPVWVDSDLALLRLSNPVITGYSGAIRANLIPLVSPAVGGLAGSTSWATGWGRLVSGSNVFPTQLYEVALPIISNTTCNNSSHWQGGITGNMLCAGNTSSGGIGTCQGDSGGPLVVTSGGQMSLAGITSFGGQTCASAQTLSVFTRVSNFVNWINTYIPDRQNIYIGGLLHGKYGTTLNQNTRVSFPVDNGPVKVVSTNGVPIVASMRVAYNDGTNWTSHSEMMGLPASQLTTSYLFPWYNNVTLNSQLRFGNVGNASTTVTVTIGGVVQNSYPLAPNASQRVSYPLDKGPVKITSSGGVPIIASMRVAYYDGTNWTSFSEMMGLPIGQVSSSYIFPWYNNVTLNSQLRFGNVGNANTTVTVTIGGVVQNTYQLAPNQSTRVSYPLDKGPVKITSTGGVPIIASMRVAYFDGTNWTDFSEMMGLPVAALSTSYSFPVYNNVDLNTQLRFGNVGNVATNVTVTIGGVNKGTFSLLPNASQRISFPGLNSGPVKITSTGGVPIIASERVAYTPDGGTTWTSFAEMMGLPANRLTTSYYFPWYNNVGLNTQIRFGVP